MRGVGREQEGIGRAFLRNGSGNSRGARLAKRRHLGEPTGDGGFAGKGVIGKFRVGERIFVRAIDGRVGGQVGQALERCEPRMPLAEVRDWAKRYS